MQPFLPVKWEMKLQFYEHTMIIQAKVVERLRGFHIPYKCIFQSHFFSLTWGRKKGCFSGSLWRLSTSENIFAHVHPGTGCQQLKGHLVDSGTGLVTPHTQRDKWWSLWPSTLTFTLNPLFGKKDHFTLGNVFACFLQLSRRWRIIVQRRFRGSLFGLQPPFFAGLLGAGIGKWQDCR